MLCDKCGTPIPEDGKVCPGCGAEVIAEETVAANAAPQVEETAPQAEAQPAFSEADFSVGKKKNKFKPLIIIGVILAVIGILVAVFWNSITAMYVRNFGSPEEYFELVEKQTFTQYADELSESYGRYLEGATGSSGKIELTISDTVLAMIPSEGLDLSWLNKVALEYEGGTEGQTTMAMLALQVSGVDLMDLSTIVDMEGNQMYLGSPMLSDKYLSTSLAGSGMTMSSVTSQEALKKALPSEEVLNEMLVRYIDVLFEHIDNVEKRKDTLTVDGVTQDVIVLEYTITEADAMKIVEALLKEAKDDPELKKVIEEMAEELVDMGLPAEAEDAYQEFQDAIDNALLDMQAYEPVSQDALVWTIYVGDDDQVVGRRVSVTDKELFFCATATDGKDFATQLDVAGMVQINGKGTFSGGVRDGDYVLVVEGQELLEAEVKYNESKSTDGDLDIKLVIRPTADLLNMMELDSSVVTLFQTMDLGLEVRVLVDGGKTEMEINAVGKGMTILGLAVTTEPKDVDVKIPSEGDVINMESEEELMEWVKSLDFDALADAMEQAKLPDEWVEAVESLNGMMALLG